MVSLGPGVHRDGDRDLLLAFPVFGEPRPQGSKRILPAGARTGGRPILVEHADAKLRKWRRAIGKAAKLAMIEIASREPITEAVVLSARFYVQRPPSHLKKSGGLRKGVSVAKTSTPDLGKYIRALEDALTDAEVWKDDRLVCGYRDCWKFWTTEPPGALVAIWGYEVSP